MSGVTRVFLLPFVALSLLLLGCGVEIAPDAITATAVANEQAAPSRSLNSTFSATTSDDTAQSLRAGSSGVEAAPATTAEPIATLASATETPTPQDATKTPEPEATAEPSATVEGDEPTPEDGASPESTIEAAETATPEPTATKTPTPEPTATPLPAVTNVNTTFAGEFLALLNAQRTGRGMGALSMNVTLTNGATEFAGYMGTGGFFGHEAPDGSSPSSRATATGYSGAWNGEALSAGQPTPQTALNALLASPPHAAILLDPRSVEVGIGYAFVSGSRYLHYWVVMTGIP